MQMLNIVEPSDLFLLISVMIITMKITFLPVVVCFTWSLSVTEHTNTYLNNYVQPALNIAAL